MELLGWPILLMLEIKGLFLKQPSLMNEQNGNKGLNVGLCSKGFVF